MEPSIFNSSHTWRTAHRRRIRTFVNACAWVVFLITTSWSFYWFSLKEWAILSLVLIVMLSALASIYWVRKQRIILAARTIIVSGGLYILTIYLLTTNATTGNHTSPFWFIVLALYSHFVLSSERNRLLKEITPVFFIVLAFLAYFKMIPYVGIIKFDEEKLRVVSMIDLFSSLLIIFIITRLFLMEITEAENKLIEYSDRLDSLVDNILPKPVAERLKKEGTTFADYVPECSVMFADISGFTPWSEKQSPTDLVNKLNELFSELDEIVDRMGLTKIKTIGDAYMVASGIPTFREDHAISLVNFAMELHTIANRYPDFKFRCGVHSGPVVAGIIGKKSIIYDMWGDTVNVASRLESHGIPGKTLVSEKTYLQIQQQYPQAECMNLLVKGKGEMTVYAIG